LSAFARTREKADQLNQARHSIPDFRVPGSSRSTLHVLPKPTILACFFPSFGASRLAHVCH
jgi:hypothetical protein